MDKKVLNLFFICLLGLFIISSVNAADGSLNDTIIGSNNYQITNDLSNEDIQLMLDNAKDGDSFELVSNEYKDISLVVDKKLNIVSKNNSVVYTSNSLSNKAKNLGIDKTFGFYFTSNSVGSVLSGIKIIASSSNYGVVVDDSNNIQLINNEIIGGVNSILIKNSDKIKISDNTISKSSASGIRLENVHSSSIINNEVSYTGRSGVETSNLYYCEILNNTVHHNVLNGISIYNESSHNSIKNNYAYDNVNGMFINSSSSYDVVTANTLSKNRNNPSSELGGFETGNGLLFGNGFSSKKDDSLLVFKYNVLIHNENFQAKNNPENQVFKLGDNWFDSNDPTDTFICPMLLAGIMKMDTISVKNGIGLQMYDTSGNAVKEFGTFDTKVNIDGNEYTAKFVNGKAVIDANLDPDKEYDVQVQIGKKLVNYKYKVASGDEGNDQDSKSNDVDGKSGASGSNNQISSGSSSGISKGGGQDGTSNSAHYANSDKSGVYGTNASGTFQDSSDNGQDVSTNGDVDSGDASEGEVSEEGKAYEVVPPSKISKEITDTSGIVVLSIISIMGMLIYGYWRKEDYD